MLGETDVPLNLLVSCFTKRFLDLSIISVFVSPSRRELLFSVNTGCLSPFIILSTLKHGLSFFQDIFVLLAKNCICVWWIFNLVTKCKRSSYKAMYSRMDQVYHFKFFKGCYELTLLRPFLNSLIHMKPCNYCTRLLKFYIVPSQPFCIPVFEQTVLPFSNIKKFYNLLRAYTLWYASCIMFF